MRIKIKQDALDILEAEVPVNPLRIPGREWYIRNLSGLVGTTVEVIKQHEEGYTIPTPESNRTMFILNEFVDEVIQ